jgi:O-antigen ligase/polysaccharide polymerase Wzy-like membrane protein
LNKIIQYIAVAIAICTAIALYIYAAFFYRFAFNYETDINGQYFAAFIAVLALTIIWGLNIFQKDDNKVQYFAVIIITLLLLVPVFSDKYGLGNEYWAEVLSVFILFACLVFLPVRIIVALPYFLVVMLLWQLWLAFTQMDGLAFDAGEFSLQGSLQNSGVFSCYLVTNLPLLYYVAFHQSISRSGLLSNLIKWLKVICFLTIVVFIAFIICRSQSRSAIIGAVAALVSQCLFTHWGALKTWLQRIPTWATNISIGFLILAASYAAWYLFFLKKASAFGRVMKWEIAGRHIGDHFFTGTGIGRFSWYYPQWQAQYFATNPNPPGAYFLSAGESYIIFNEYLQLFETIGLIGFAGFALLLYWFFKSRSIQYARLLSAMKTTMVVVLATGLTTYVFHVNVFLVLVAICFAVTAVISHKPLSRQRGSVMPFLFVLSAYTTFAIYQKWKAVESWNTAREGSADADLTLWSELNKTFGQDGKFLTEYGQRQLESGHPEAAIVTLEKARQSFISRNTMEALATAYEQAGNYPAAIETRRWLCGFLPNRFIPRYELLKLYKKTGDTTGINKTINIILTMPVKIPSAEVDRIKEEAKKMSGNYN